MRADASSLQIKWKSTQGNCGSQKAQIIVAKKDEFWMVRTKSYFLVFFQHSIHRPEFTVDPLISWPHFGVQLPFFHERRIMTSHDFLKNCLISTYIYIYIARVISSLENPKNHDYEATIRPPGPSRNVLCSQVANNLQLETRNPSLKSHGGQRVAVHLWKFIVFLG